MPAFDRIVAVVTLVGLGGVLLVRAFQAWAEYRLQRRELELLIQSVTEAEQPHRERRQ